MSPHLLPALVAQVAVPAAARVIDDVVDVLDFKSFLGKASEASSESQSTTENSGSGDGLSSADPATSSADILSELKSLAQKIRQRLSQIAAVHNTSEFSIRSDESGGFHVDSDSSNRASIEQELASDSEFKAAFSAVFQGLSQIPPEIASLFVGDLQVDHSHGFAPSDRGTGSQKLHKFALAFQDGGVTARFDG